MEKYETLTSLVAPLPLKDVDTDMLIPAQFLTSVSREGYGQNLFRRLRDQDPQFVLNDPRFTGASILLSDENSGCGSSREHAVWALLGHGFRVVIAKSFADIFFGNSAKSGLLLVSLPVEVVDQLLAQAKSGGLRLTVDLENQLVKQEGTNASWHFNYDPYRKHCLLHGQDDLDYLLSRKDEISKFRATKAIPNFFKTLEANNP